MNFKKPIGPRIAILIFLTLIPTYLHYQYGHFVKLSKAQLIFEHNKNYTRKMSFQDKEFLNIFNSAVSSEIEQITFSELKFKGNGESVKVFLLGDKPYFFTLIASGVTQESNTFNQGQSESKIFLFQTFAIKTNTIKTKDQLAEQLIFAPYIPSYLGHIQTETNKDYASISFQNITITANIKTNSNGLIRSIETNKHSSYYDDYENIKGVQIPHTLIVDSKEYSLKKAKLNSISKRR